MIFLRFVGLDTGAAGNQRRDSYDPVFLRVGRIMLSSVIAEKGHGNLYLITLYWRRARKHVAIAWKINSDLRGNFGGVRVRSSPRSDEVRG